MASEDVVEKARSTTSSISKDDYGSRDSASVEAGFWGKLRAVEGNDVKRGMQSRHLMMIGVCTIEDI